MYRATLFVTGTSVVILALLLFVDAPADAPILDPEVASASEEIDTRVRAIEERRSARRQVARAVAEGQLTFAAGTEEFAAMMRVVPGEAEVTRAYFPGTTDTERAAQQLIAYVKAIDFPVDERAAVVARLHTEYATQFGRSLVPTV